MKDIILKTQRGIGFEDVIACIVENAVVELTPHHNLTKYPHQFIYQVEIDGYIWLVPAVKEGNNVRLITAYPSRKATKKHVKGESHEKNKR